MLIESMEVQQVEVERVTTGDAVRLGVGVVDDDDDFEVEIDTRQTYFAASARHLPCRETFSTHFSNSFASYNRQTTLLCKEFEL
jgi:hypothetical protein